MEQKKEKKYIVGSILCGLLTAFGIVATVISLIGGSKGMWSVVDCATLVLLLLIAYYAFNGYRKPHGNLLKYIMLFRTIPLFFAIYVISNNFEAHAQINVILGAVTIGLICYIAGRLNKVKENTVLLFIVMACFVVELFSDFIAGVATLGAITPLIIWLDICVAYFLRYKQHREAGLEDAPKSK